ncbi:MAG: sugar ABC transporter ATP-binding protein [Armatimonadetes bacterium]|nr:sugar ABC transporter ATP-binding protein [Armatimonadota bacterium]
MSDPLLAISNISKAFPGVQALDDVSLALGAGEVLALVGENGAGKSTLMHILSGLYSPDSGQIRLGGEAIRPRDPREATRIGISIVHQEMSLTPNLSVAENIFSGRLPRKRFLDLIDWQTLRRQAADLLEPFELSLDPMMPVGRLSVAQRQLVEIAKALSVRCRALILDEPTSALAGHETELLFGVVRRLKAAGVGIIYITHKLKEVFEIADRVAVLKDGRLVDTVTVPETAPDRLIRMMVGRDLSTFYPDRPTAADRSAPPLLEVENLTTRKLHGVSLRLWPGEVVGMAGLVGAGRTELGRAIFGADPVREGHVRVEGRPRNIGSPAGAIAAGIAYLPEDRKEDGLFLGMSVRANLVAASLNRFAAFGWMDRQAESRVSADCARQLNIRTPSLEQLLGHLSGGNQQKTLISKWLLAGPKVLIVDEPTRGIDVGAKAEIYALLRRLANEGLSILMISSELPEILGMSDRILVLYDGRLAAELDGHTATEEQIMAAATGHA